LRKLFSVKIVRICEQFWQGKAIGSRLAIFL
jgi:hypothetical protein